MPLTPGTKLGPYEIQSPLGAGGMGEVYCARDTRLDRTVAIKILPDHLADSPEAQERFEREARSISSLSHPNICHLYDVGHEGSTRYLVMEYLQGESLAQRLSKGPLPLEQLLRVAAEVADGLDRAHRSGVVHRDLKPGNIMLTKSGAKLLDFGLAKAAAQTAANSGATVTYAPTAATKITQAGVVVGTFQYMSPEQIEGHDADARSDIFAFGAVLYEMATGRCAFEGKSQISVASAILEKEPEPITSILPAAPPALDHVIRGCLAKDPDARWQSAGDIARQLRWISSGGSQTSAALATLPRKKPLERILWASLAVALLAAVISFALRPHPAAPVVRASINPPADTTFYFDGDFGGPPVISPDGTQIVFSARSATAPPALYVQSLTAGVAIRLEGTDHGFFPFWSPDSKTIAFFDYGKLRKIPAAGGPITVITDATNGRGGAWGSDNVILFAADYRGPLYRVDANGGTPVPATAMDASLHSTHRWPFFLPDGKHFLFFATNHGGGTTEKNGVYLGQLGDPGNKLLIQTEAQAAYAGGYLLYQHGAQLLAQNFDPSAGKLSGDPVSVLEGVSLDQGTWHSTFSASSNGVLVYQGGSGRSGFNLVLTDRKGKLLKSLGEHMDFNGAVVSPDGKRYLAVIGDPKRDIWVYGLESGTRTRLTFDGVSHQMPNWSPDGRHVVFESASGPAQANGSTLRSVLANGGGEDQTLYEEHHADGSHAIFLWPEYTRDGKYLVFHQRGGGDKDGIFALPLVDGKPEKDKAAFAVLHPTPGAAIVTSAVSPDGKWLAYTETDSGREEVYITSFPSGQGRWQVTREGGTYPLWRADGKEIYYVTFNFDLTAASIKTGPSGVELGPPEILFRPAATVAAGMPYAVTPDGQRFISPGELPGRNSAPISLFVNWPASLKK